MANIGSAVLVVLCLASAAPLTGASSQDPSRQTAFVLAPTWVYDLFPFDVPGAESAWATGINNHNEIVGGYFDGVAYVSFVLSGGVLTPLVWSGVNATDINDSGVVVGSYIVNTGSQGEKRYAFQYSAGTFSTVPFPAAFPGAFGGTWLVEAYASDINNHGNIVGWFRVRDVLEDTHPVQLFRCELLSRTGLLERP